MTSVCDLTPPVIAGSCIKGFREAGEVHVWLLDARGPDTSLLEQWSAALLGAEEPRRARAMASAEVRRDHLAGRLALRLLLSAYCPEVPPREWRLSRREGGRPVVAAPPGGPAAPSFSISHNEGRLALAFHGAGEPGVDVESASRRVDMMALARRYFSAAEIEMLEALSGEALRAGFLRCWTLKEASVKADGTGLAGELSRRGFRWTEEGRVEALSPDGRRWQYWSWRWQSSHMLGVALRQPAGWQGKAVTCRPFTLSLRDGSVADADVADAFESPVV